jgi:hypothetical protein
VWSGRSIARKVGSKLNHEEIKDLMPAMQMEFNVKDKTLLDKVKTGDRVDFTIVETEKGEWLTEIKKIPLRDENVSVAQAFAWDTRHEIAASSLAAKVGEPAPRREMYSLGNAQVSGK